MFGRKSKGLIQPNRLDLSNIIVTPRTKESPSSVSHKPGYSLPNRIASSLANDDIPPWLRVFVTDGSHGSTKRIELAFKCIEEIERLRLKLCEKSDEQYEHVLERESERVRYFVREGWLGDPVSMTEAHKKAISERNRYTDIVPFDQTRISLKYPSVIVPKGAFNISPTNTANTSAWVSTVSREFASISSSFKSNFPAFHPFNGLGTAQDQTPKFQPPQSDYINASLLSAAHMFPRKSNNNAADRPGTKRYIAAQGPLHETCPDFWNMVLDNNVAVVVMLTKEEEKGRVKCCRYWPRDGGYSASSHTSNSSGSRCANFIWSRGSGSGADVDGPGSCDLEIEIFALDSRTVGADIVVRQFEIAIRRQSACVPMIRLVDGGKAIANESQIVERRIVHQVHYLGWADHKGSDPTSVLAVIDVANEIQNVAGLNAGPMVVHCSAGCGRTGTFCVIDAVLDHLQLDNQSAKDLPPSVDDVNLDDPIFRCVMTFRSQRVSVVQTMEQYAFCYEAIIARIAEWSSRK
ncbi:hypothetical protein HDU82_005960 [Entophlyctis luteolus]|nr:hypothetical protein HDU82_005960 [Entophlyctis luteolus]